MPRRRLRLLATLLAGLVVVLAATVQAQAVGLGLSSAGLTWHSGTFSRTCSGPVTVSPVGAAVNGTYTQLAVTGLNSTCAGTGYVSLRTSAGTVVVDRTAAVSGGGFTVTASAYTPPTATDGKVFVSVDTWPVAATWVPLGTSLGTCTVVSVNSGTTTGKSCTVVGYRVVDNNDGAPVGSRTWHVYLTINAQMSSNGSQEAELQLNLAAAGLPANWQWGNAGVVTGNLIPYPGAPCSALPTLHAYAPGWAGNGTEVYFDVVENRTGVSGLACS